MGDREQALRVLLSARRTLSGRLAEHVVGAEVRMLRATKAGCDPLAVTEELDRLATGLARINHAIAAVRASGGRPQRQSDRKTAPEAGTPRNHAFSKFLRLVQRDRPEEAARALARLIRLPGESAFTATRFFTRAVRRDPSIVGRLASLCAQIDSTPEAVCMETLMAAFGLQAVESMNAGKALRSLQQPESPAESTNSTTTTHPVDLASAR